MSIKIVENKSNIFYLALAFILTFVACTPSTKEEIQTTGEKQKIEKEESNKEVELTDEQMKAVGIELGKIELKNLNDLKSKIIIIKT